MKRTIKLFISTFIIISIAISLVAPVEASVRVKGYLKKDGTYVAPYYRSDPDGNTYNNWSYPGNINPYTGEVAPGNQDIYIENYYNTPSYLPDISPLNYENSFNMNNDSSIPDSNCKNIIDSNAVKFTVGSTKEQVIRSNGAPSKIYDTYGSRNLEYGYSTIFFDSNWKVTSWNNASLNLNVSIGEKESGALPFTLESSLEKVVKAMGTPSLFESGSYSKYIKYDFPTVYFDNNWKVSSWYDSSNILNAN